MPRLPIDVNDYLINGCGRCKLGGTPQCKVHSWHTEIQMLRGIALNCGLTEEIKWGSPCYTYNQKNVLMISALKESCVISFFMGAMMKDSNELLQKAGKNSHVGRIIRFTQAQDIVAKQNVLKELILQAIELEKKGVKTVREKPVNTVPAELEKRFQDMPELKVAFYALTPGRQRGYILHISSAQKSATRESRIDKCVPDILAGKGFHDY